MSTDTGRSNAHLVGIPDSAASLSTPALILDLDAVERNLGRMADTASASGCRLRPHAKAHKSAAAAARQMKAGAIGISCATLQEAEVMAAGGVGSILITSPVAGEAAVARLIALHGAVADLIIVVDHPANAAALAAAAGGAGKPLSVLVDYDVGQKRTGVVGEENAVALARQVAGSDHLRFRGVQAYYGHLQHIEAYAERKAATEGPRKRIRELAEALSRAGLAPEIVSGGGTGTHHIDMQDGVFTEIQAGSYLFMDSQYAAVELWPDDPRPFEAALFVQGTVVSCNQPDYAVVNCGWKAFATEGEAPVPLGAGTSYRFMGDEHGGVAADDPGRFELGQMLRFHPPHCDPTVNLFSAFHCIRDGMLVDIWPISARGY